MINVNISQDKQAIKSYTWLHVDMFLDYCTIAAWDVPPSNPLTFRTISARALKVLLSYNSGFPMIMGNEQAHYNQDTQKKSMRTQESSWHLLLCNQSHSKNIIYSMYSKNT